MDDDMEDIPDEIIGPTNVKDGPDSPSLIRKITQMKSFHNLLNPLKEVVKKETEKQASEVEQIHIKLSDSKVQQKPNPTPPQTSKSMIKSYAPLYVKLQNVTKDRRQLLLSLAGQSTPQNKSQSISSTPQTKGSNSTGRFSLSQFSTSKEWWKFRRQSLKKKDPPRLSACESASSLSTLSKSVKINTANMRSSPSLQPVEIQTDQDTINVTVKNEKVKIEITPTSTPVRTHRPHFSMFESRNSDPFKRSLQKAKALQHSLSNKDIETAPASSVDFVKDLFGLKRD